MRRPRQLTFRNLRERSGRGGQRPGAGRPRGPRPVVYHVRRSPVPKGAPCHVTIRVRPGLPSLRTRRFVRAFRETLHASCERGSFRVVHYSLQRDHVHLIVEAAGKHALGCGMKSISARTARLINRLAERSGPVLLGRYHVRVLRAPRQVRHALAYVLLNVRKHWRQRHGAAPPARLDVASSGRWFDGWRRAVPGMAEAHDGLDPPDVAGPRSWLLQTGWRRHGLLDPAEVPGTSMRRTAAQEKGLAAR